eukprot:5417788-Pyramimonas_sp.AAC.1
MPEPRHVVNVEITCEFQAYWLVAAGTHSIFGRANKQTSSIVRTSVHASDQEWGRTGKRKTPNSLCTSRLKQQHASKNTFI